MKRLVFSLTQLLHLPMSVLGALVFALRVILDSRRRDISMTAYVPLLGRVLMHDLGERPDPEGKALLENLPTTSVPAVRAMLEPTLFASRLSGYRPDLLLMPTDQDMTIATMLNGRARFFDDLVDHRSEQASQFVILGGGYDTRTLGRFRETGLRFFELDRPRTQQTKREALCRAGIPADGTTFVEVDFTASDWFDRLVDAGYREDAATVFLWEGVSEYLPEAVVRNSLETLAKRSGPGSSLGVDFLSDKAQNPPSQLGRWSTEVSKLVLNVTREPFKFAPVWPAPIRTHIEEFLASTGWQLEHLAKLPFEAGSEDAAGALCRATR
ncbi:class I SAM-dependent methyltransferase [Acaricomes phytoseiuli]|nr:class I SAM-dependent methyltransferase [Acaricomes phytoseiuli]